MVSGFWSSVDGEFQVLAGEGILVRGCSMGLSPDKAGLEASEAFNFIYPETDHPLVDADCHLLKQD